MVERRNKPSWIRSLMQERFGVELPKLDLAPSEKKMKITAYQVNPLDDPAGVTFTDPYSFEVPPDTIELGEGGADFRTSEEGWDGTTYNYGIAYRGDNGEKDYPVVWRGLRMDYGLAHRVFLGSTVYQRGVFDIINTLRSVDLRVDPADVEAGFEQAAQAQAYQVEDALRNLEGGWETFIGEAVYSLAVPGFGIWQRIHYPDGRLRRLAFRRPNSLDGILFDEHGQRIVAFRFVTSTGGTYIVDARDCLVLSYLPLGNDIEGLSGWRASSEYELAKQEFVEIIMISGHKFGAPRDVAEVQAGVVLSEDDKTVLGNALDDHAGNNPINLVLPPGVRIASLRPDGPLSDFLPFLRYLDEQIGLPLSAEGALFTGSSGAGSYAALDVKDRQKLSTAGAFLSIILSGLMGSTGEAFHGPLRVMIDALGGPVDGRYPQLAIAVEDEDTGLADIALAADKGLIQVTLEVQRAIHKKLNLPEPPEPETSTGANLSDGAEPLWKKLRGYARESVQLHDAGCPCCADRLASARRFEAHRSDKSLYLSDDQPNLFKAPLTPDEMKEFFNSANAQIAKLFEGLAQEMRREWAEATAGLSFSDLIPIRDEFRTRYLPRFREAAIPGIGKLFRQGELSLPAEMGILKKVPSRGLTPSVNDPVLGLADAAALKSYNITEHHLFERARLEANGLPERKMPPIPTSSAYVSQVASMTAPAFSIGRDTAIQTLYNVAVSRAPAGKVPRMIAEYSSVMEENTCDSCAALDGIRVFVGSDEYNRIKPPSVCEGGERCRCIFTYFADEQDFEEIYNEVESGFSQVRGFELHDEEVG